MAGRRRRITITDYGHEPCPCLDLLQSGSGSGVVGSVMNIILVDSSSTIVLWLVFWYMIKWSLVVVANNILVLLAS